MNFLGRFQCTPLPYVTFQHCDFLVQISVKMLTASFQSSVTFYSFNLFFYLTKGGNSQITSNNAVPQYFSMCRTTTMNEKYIREKCLPSESFTYPRSSIKSAVFNVLPLLIIWFDESTNIQHYSIHYFLTLLTSLFFYCNYNNYKPLDYSSKICVCMCGCVKVGYVACNLRTCAVCRLHGAKYAVCRLHGTQSADCMVTVQTKDPTKTCDSF